MIVVRLIPFLVTLIAAGTVILLSDLHSWSSEATTWVLAAVFGGSTVVDLTLSRWWERASRHRRERRRTAHLAK